jgi:hypothetical protein
VVYEKKFISKLTNYLITLVSIFICVNFSFSATYYVSLKGKNTNSGTYKHPFYSLQFASKKLKPGDTLYVRGGHYTENCNLKLKGTKSRQIVIQNYNNEKVVFIPTRLKLVWKQHSKNIFRAKINSKITQVFLNQTPIMQARFPNIIEGEMLKDKWLNVHSNADKEIKCNIPRNINFKNSKFIGLCGRGTIAITGKVIQQDKKSVTLKNKDFYWNKKYKTAYLGKGKGYFVGNISFLDTLNEWYSNDEYIYWYSKPPSYLNIRFRTKNDVFNLIESAYIKLKGIDFIGKSISFGNSEHCSLTESKIEYPTPFFDFEYSFDRGCNPENDSSIYWKGKGVVLNGTNNRIQNSSISHSWGDGVSTFGKNNKLFNSNIHDCNWMGTDAAALNFYGDNHIVKHCFLSKTGRSVILHSNSKNCKILFNEIAEGGYLCDDLGLTYNYGTDGKGTEIAYNWLHHNRAPHYGSGIYLDNGNANFKVHHNVIWKCFVGMTINETASNDSIYNNTFFKNKYTMGSAWFTEYAPKIINVKTFNNITDSELKARDQQPFYGTIQANNVIIPHLSNFMINPYENNFSLDYEKLNHLKKNGAYADVNYWRAGLISSKLNQSIEKQTNTSTVFYQIICYLILLSLLIFLIQKINFYRSININPLILFSLSILSGIIFWFVFSYIYPNRETAELFKHFDDANLIYKQEFLKSPINYLNFILTGETNSSLKEILHQTNFWYKFPNAGFNENHFLIKIHAWILPFSFGNIFTHLLLFSFIGFNGVVLLFKTVTNFNVSKSYLIFYIPSFWIFANSGTKDSIIFISISFILYVFTTNNFKKWIVWIFILFAFYLMYVLRPYIALAFIPFIFTNSLQLISKKQINFYLIFIFYVLMVLCFFQINQIQLFETLKFKQNDLILVAKEMHSSTSFEMLILNKPMDLFYNAIPSIYNVLFKPLTSDVKNIGMILMTIENWVLMIIILYSIISSIKNRNGLNMNLLLFCVLIFLFIGWTVPMSGVILRFRAIIIPFFLISIFYKKEVKTVD